MMKTPKEWLEDLGHAQFNEEYIKKIQADAWLSAMINAAAIANQFADYDPTRDGRRIARKILDDSQI